MLSLARRESSKPTTFFNRSWEPLRLMEELLTMDPYYGVGGVSSFVPSLEVKETKESFIVRADVPGVEEKDLCACERRYASFSRQITLPQGLDTDKLKAELKAGVLTLELHKKPETLPKRIEIEAVD